MLSPPGLSRFAARRLGPAGAAAILELRRPKMDLTVRYALFPTCADEPKTFDKVGALARHIHKARRRAALELAEDELQLQGETYPRRVVSVYQQDEGGSRVGLIGHAWLDGQGRTALDAALRAARADRSTTNLRAA